MCIESGGDRPSRLQSAIFAANTQLRKATGFTHENKNTRTIGRPVYIGVTKYIGRSSFVRTTLTVWPETFQSPTNRLYIVRLIANDERITQNIIQQQVIEINSYAFTPV